MSDFFGYQDEARMREALGNSFVDTVLAGKVTERKMRVCTKGEHPCLGGGWYEDHPFDYGYFETIGDEQRRVVVYQDMGREITIRTVVYKGKTISF